jgi:hypothetical protein
VGRLLRFRAVVAGVAPAVLRNLFADMSHAPPLPVADDSTPCLASLAGVSNSGGAQAADVDDDDDASSFSHSSTRALACSWPAPIPPPTPSPEDLERFRVDQETGGGVQEEERALSAEAPSFGAASDFAFWSEDISSRICARWQAQSSRCVVQTLKKVEKGYGLKGGR